MKTNVLSAAFALTFLSGCANNKSFAAGQPANYLAVLQDALLQPPSQSDLDGFNEVTFNEYFQALVSGTTNDAFQLGAVTVAGVHDRLLNSASLFARLHVQYGSVGEYFNTLELDLSQPLDSAVVEETYTDLAADFNEQDGWFGGDMSVSASLTETAHSVTLQQTDQVLRNIAALNAVAMANASPLEVGFGLFTNPAANCDQPSAVHLKTANGGVCSGVAVSSTQVLTAAHCLDSGKSLSYVGSDGKTYTSSDVAVNPGYDTDDFAKTAGFDNAVATFAPNSELATSRLAEVGVQPGDNVSMAGYGSIGPDREVPVDIGNLHCGYNVVKSTTVHQATIEITGVLEGGQGIPKGQDSINRPGDSGGPMFNDQGQVVGVVSYSESKEKRAGYSNLNDSANKKFLAGAIKRTSEPTTEADPEKRNPFVKTTPVSRPTGNTPFTKTPPTSP